MIKLIFKFLNTKFPNAFVKKTIFGDIAMFGDDYISTHKLTKELCDWFDVDEDYIRLAVDEWIAKLPVVVSLRNSTNPDLWVAEPIVVNTTTL
jgi:hypothetical protein